VFWVHRQAAANLEALAEPPAMGNKATSLAGADRHDLRFAQFSIVFHFGKFSVGFVRNYFRTGHVSRDHGSN
jgi:hypothetical protein